MPQLLNQLESLGSVLSEQTQAVLYDTSEKCEFVIILFFKNKAN